MIENLFARCAMSLCSVWFRLIVVIFFREDVSLWRRDCHNSMSSGMLYKERANGLVSAGMMSKKVWETGYIHQRSSVGCR